jgi:hypothetical protein
VTSNTSFVRKHRSAGLNWGVRTRVDLCLRIFLSELFLPIPVEAIYSISVKEELEELFYPSFFERSERKDAYEYVMLWGNEEDKRKAQEAKSKYPFDEPFLVYS